jgi:quinol monooxygenase YgiN
VIYVVATLIVKPEMRSELIAASKDFISKTRQEPGCIAFDMHESVSDHSKLVFFEQWKSVDELPAHGAATHTKTFLGLAGPCLAAPTKLEIITPQTVEVREAKKG